MKDRIIEYGKNDYASSPHEFSDSDIDIIIENDCQCYYCGKSIFEMWDFPEVLEEEKEVLCEECYDEHYRDICPICEDYYEIKSVKGENTPFPKSPFYWFNSITEEEWKEYESVDGEYKPSGIYQAIKYPVFIAACGGLGDTWIQWDNIEFVCSIEDFVGEHFTDNGRKWDEYEEWIQDSRKRDKANFIGDCCWGTALSIKNSKGRKEMKP
jgi:hypothetical protein